MRARLEDAIQSTFAALDIDLSRWIVPLSGGHDSRAILLFLRSLDGVTAVTWGSRPACNDPESDASIGPEIARSLGINHLYFSVDPRPDAAEESLDTFLLAGEGRVTNVSAYLDGFALWKHLRDAEWHGIIRGDEALGYKKVSNRKEVYNLCKITTLNDLPDLRAHAADLDVVDHSRPQALDQRAGETLATWRDRLIIIGPIIAALVVTVWEIYGVAFQDELPGRPAPAAGEPAPESARILLAGEEPESKPGRPSTG